ncbi:SAF domain-containing protein [Cellulomonas sp.]|uniref:SAF domain-containing protein n=1 Tax=Cellulomonas sp. TaxID=40001 RepID=UPI003BAA9CCD
MTTTSEKQKLNGQRDATELRPAGLVGPRGRRRPALLVAGVAMVALGALAVAWLVSSAGQRTDVVVMARDVAYGSTIVAGDLGTTAVSVDPTVRLVQADDASTLVGQVAATNLARGSLVEPADVTQMGVVGPDEVLVPLPLSADRVPAGGLAAGDRLLVVDAPPLGADPATGAPESFQARVVRAGPPDINGLVMVDVVAAAADGPALATRAATGRFAIVVQPAQVAP